MTLVGPSITVVCRNTNCDEYGIEKVVRSTVLDPRSRLLDWPHVTCTCLHEPEQIATGEATP